MVRKNEIVVSPSIYYYGAFKAATAATTTKTKTKTSLGKWWLFCDYYFFLAFLFLTEHAARTGRSADEVNITNERCAVVFFLTLEFSRRHSVDYVKELCWSTCRTCSMIIGPHSINQTIDLWRSFLIATAVVLAQATTYCNCTYHSSLKIIFQPSNLTVR